MLHYITGDLLKSDAEALVNTVNCEGFMGKGLAYQFKLQFPENNIDYVKACKQGRLRPGTLHYYVERGKVIINFPTKDKWREKSKMEYIENGLDALIELISQLKIQSIAIPPLGSGNGGLIWAEVREVIEKKLHNLSISVEIYVFEPSRNYSKAPVMEPKLGPSALVLMEIKENLVKFSAFRLQKAAYFSNLFYGKNYFNFAAYKYGPYDHSIDIVSKGIREFQKYHGTKSTREAKAILYNKLVSSSVERKLSELHPAIQKGCAFVNSIASDHELEALSTTCFLIEKAGGLTADGVISGYRNWSSEKSERFSDQEILASIEKLCQAGVVEETLVGYDLAA